MKTAILGGTGKLGSAIAIRLSRSGHDVTIGSRDISKAVQAAKSLEQGVAGASNAEAAAWCEAAFVAAPYSGHRLLLESVKQELRGKIIIDATVPLDPANLLQVKTESGKSAAEEAAAIIPDGHVFAAFQTISHHVLGRPDSTPDVLVAGGGRKSEVVDLIRSMNLKPIDAGSLEIAGHFERLTALLLSINRANKVRESGIKITGI